MSYGLTRTHPLFLVALLISIVSPVISQSPFTLPPMDDNSKTYSYSAGGQRETVPKGIFHYSDTENNFGANFKVPDTNQIDPLRMISDLMNTAATVEQRKKQLSGVYLPMPFGLSPLNLQVSQDGSTGFSTNKKQADKKEENGSQSPRVRQLFLAARRECMNGDKSRCDAALEAYQTAKHGQSPLETRLISQGTAPKEPDQIVQTEMAKWLLPSLGDRLEEMKTGREDEDRGKEEDEDEENDDVVASTQSYSEQTPLNTDASRRRLWSFSRERLHPSSVEDVGPAPSRNPVRYNYRTTTIRPYKTPPATSKIPITAYNPSVRKFLQELHER